MKKNLGIADRSIRIILAAVIIALCVAGYITGTIAIVLSVVAVVLLLTSIFSFCPLYALLKISTIKKP